MEEGQKREQERIINLIIQETGHNGKTHYEGMYCYICKLIEKIEGEIDET